MNIECLHSVIGLSESDCPCLPFNDYSNVSWSGQYVDNVMHGIGLNITNSIQDCEDSGVWAKMNAARHEAISQFLTHFNIALSRYKVPRYEGYKGFFGERSKKGNAYRNGLRQFNGFGIFPRKHFEGATLCIDRIELGINAMDDYDVMILRQEGDQWVTVDTVTVTVGSLFTGEVDTNLVLPMSDQYGRPICYALAFDAKGNKVKDYKYHCGCPGIAKPNWMNDRIVAAQGFSVRSLDTLAQSNFTSDYTNGMIVDFAIKCDPFDWLCDQDTDFWQCNNFGRVLAKVLVLMSNKILASQIVNSDRPDFYTLLTKEQLYGRIKHYDGLVNELVDYLVTDGLPEQMKCCLICNPKHSMGFRKSEIIV